MIHVVLYEPEIPQNTGNIMRTCVASGAALHLIEPLGFILDEKRVKRSVMDYSDDLNLTRHLDWESFLKTVKGPVFYLTRYGEHTHSDFDYTAIEETDIYLVFGKESTGIPKSILKENYDHCFRIPMAPNARSMNLSNTVAICVFEVLRQIGYPELATHEVLKGKDFLKDF
ncbi:tRNA (cytidine(34)-2'-O)-methyltransferase [Erysipelothrix amsterdamensis]|uniref:Putative tRNA (cytidine(34)-2'-O)-methyltransferase n=1 Tax=Erysipelothrix amsterdamensis TaxID=2929157 RepID=A0AAU9VFL5_9FIRM|nr:tRNA (cytidine(34)-2'-O)-methyltransferase [Erysipelothrix rhusiopathiae]CAH2761779.1 tRNA (cytidine(34)-2'-O)-methyltransferase [Erysipelothrix sp. A18Y020d]AYV34868.1 tRNA (cytidine(34)-2'-O)-methyltransferase [Erysipelothrix rhusiopathiae]MDE8082192.1 tRNA (cytidine(34)-2'-O)-methyltransferase [Erysipelothrix rhusiopathiae]MDE8314302.1 tRNA (cytidine(34)-2'-O)-methyltransferase [Erysipelothrix rhusiopathiae]MDE8329647.1 tRNA (cytidine(34)-2'-O)-methyltransferase [Erysipelothrix rhusiopat